MKVAICIPSGRTWESEMGMSLCAIVREAADIEIAVLNQGGSQISMQRNKLVESALEYGADYLFWMDSDLVMPPTTLHELLAAQKVIVGAAYCKKAEPYELVARLRRTDGRLKAADYLPGGCMLVKASVYRGLDWPWYYEVPIPEERSFISEDFAFCRKAIAAGHEIWCDIHLSQRLVHLGVLPVRFQLSEGHEDAIL